MKKSQRKNLHKKTHISALSILIGCLCVLSLSGCKKAISPRVETRFALDTVVSVTYYNDKDRETVEKALQLCEKYGKIFSRTDPESELYRLNSHAGETVIVSEELYVVLFQALSYVAETNGAFDPTLGGVSLLYGFGSEQPSVPTEERLAEALSHSGPEKVHLLSDRRVLVDDPELVLDLGGIAKGYIADKMRELMMYSGMSSGIINLGGNVLVIAEKPTACDFFSGKPIGETVPYEVGIARPEPGSDEMITTVSVTNTSVVTSGINQRFFMDGGALYHHILNPLTGKPVQNNLRSVTIITPSSLDADALSTALFVMGPEKIAEYTKNHPGIEVILVDMNYNVTRLGGN